MSPELVYADRQPISKQSLYSSMYMYFLLFTSCNVLLFDIALYDGFWYQVRRTILMMHISLSLIDSGHTVRHVQMILKQTVGNIQAKVNGKVAQMEWNQIKSSQV